MKNRTITAVFDTQAEAERAIEALAAQGIPRSDMRIHRDMPDAPAENQDKGFWASLADLFMPDEDRGTYAEALRRGSVMVSAQVDDSQYEQAATLLESAGAVDLDERESSWRSEGWTGSTAGMATSGAAGMGAGAMATGGMGSGLGTTRDANVTSAAGTATRMGMATGDNDRPGTMLSRGVDDVAGTNISGAHPENEMGSMGTTAGRATGTGSSNPPGTMLSRGVDEVAGTNISGAHPEHETGMTGGMGMHGSGTTRTTDMTGEQSIPVVEETLRVGKRDTSTGRVRVRSYVVETPIEEQVTLRQEHVDVERRAVDRPVTDADRLFEDRTIEATETSEEAVVAKEARVTEEVVIHKDVDQRTETVRDTLRRTEVEVDRDTDTTGGTTRPRGT